MRVIVLCLCALLLLGAANPYEKIEKQAQAEALLNDVQANMASKFKLRLTKPVQIYLVTPQEMDKMMSKSPYKGAEVGIYTGIENGKHQVYVMNGWNRDVCSGITAHELTHAWQEENAPADQAQTVKEGFAMWVEYKFYDMIGAYTAADEMRQTADPVYGVGFFRVLEVEDVVGTAKVADTMRTASQLNQLPSKKPR